MIIFSVFHIPAHYGSEFQDQTLTTELMGSKFLALKTNDKYPAVYRFVTYVFYYKPIKITNRYYGFPIAKYPNISLLDDYIYLVESKQSASFLIYGFGKDFPSIWKNNIKNIEIYDNGFFNIYILKETKNIELKKLIDRRQRLGF